MGLWNGDGGIRGGTGGCAVRAFRPGFQPSGFSFGPRTQGVALGWYRAGRWPFGARQREAASRGLKPLAFLCP